MKHEQYFDNFLNDTVNLNQSRLDTLKDKVEKITDLLEKNVEGYRKVKVSEQGSYAHKTIIKPVQDNDEFDADLLLFIKDDSFDINQFNDYVKIVFDIFKNNGNYKDITHLNTRCVTINYSGDFHIDIVPCIENGDSKYICNRKNNCYEETDGEGYKDWLIGKNQTVGKNYFRKTTRLLKFLRDHKDNFSVKSILLTTLLGNQVNGSNSYKDLPTTLKSLSNGLNTFLQNNPSMPTVKNPVLSDEDFNRNWDESKYKNFGDKFNAYNDRIDDAYQETDHNESVKKWRKIFGDNFGELKTSSSADVVAGVAGISTVSATKPYLHD